jgi:hypothetical protein
VNRDFCCCYFFQVLSRSSFSKMACRAALLLLFCSSKSVLSVAPSWDELENEMSYSFERFRVDFGKEYTSPDEYSRREAIFQQNRKTIFEHNRQTYSNYKLGVNHFMDFLEEEMPLGYDKSMHSAWHSESSSSAVKRKLHTRVRKMSLGDCALIFAVLIPDDFFLLFIRWSCLSIFMSTMHCQARSTGEAREAL